MRSRSRSRSRSRHRAPPPPDDDDDDDDDDVVDHLQHVTNHTFGNKAFVSGSSNGVASANTTENVSAQLRGFALKQLAVAAPDT